MGTVSRLFMQLREKTGVMYSSQPYGGHICILRGSEEHNTVEFIFLLKIKIILDVTLRRLVVVTKYQVISLGLKRVRRVELTTLPS